ncbi:predicted protein, partial [Nematostella vectensis]
MARGGSPNWLSEQMRSGNYVLLLDCRPFAEFVRSHIQGAINLTIPSLMLRRMKKGNNFSFTSLISSEEGKEQFNKNLHMATAVVLYDSNTKDIASIGINSVMAVLIKKLADECASGTLRLLEGGFSKFEERFPSFCEPGEESGRPLLSLSGLTIREASEQAVPSRILLPNVQPSTPENRNVSNCELAEILPRLYLGSEKDASNIELLRKHKISYVLNVTHDRPNTFAHIEGFKYKNLPVEDNLMANLTELFPEAFAFIDEGRQKSSNVLVHCLAGISRSVTITIAYLMSSQHLSLNEAYDFVKARKSNVSPNFNFMGQLLDFERSL